MILENPFFEIDSNDISATIRSLTPSFDIEAQDDTTGGDDTRSTEAGLLVWSFAITANQNFAAAALDSIIYPLWQARAAVAIEFRPTTSAVGGGNPKWTGNGIVQRYSPISGPGTELGGHILAAFDIAAAGTLTRAVA